MPREGPLSELLTDFIAKTLTPSQAQWIFTNVMSIGITLLIVLVTIALLWIYQRKQASANKKALLLGLSQSGKTKMFCQLVHGRDLLTQISISSNNGEALLEKKLVSLIDSPGQSKIRSKFFDLLKKSAKVIVFVVDSSTYSKEAKDVAEFVFQILTDDLLINNRTRMLIVCNKQDIDFAKTENFIRTNLEKEIELLRKISTSALESTDGGSSSSAGAKLTKDATKPFEFNDLKSFRVDFCESSCQKESKLAGVSEWLRANV